jgi:Chaperone of endosialidase
MNRTLLSTVLLAALSIGTHAGYAATFNYHGNLQEAGNAANGAYDLELTLYSSPEGGKVLAGPLQMFAVPVHDGSFSTQADFGVLTKVPNQAWLGVKVRRAGQTTFSALDARAPVGADAVASTCPGSWALGGNAGNPAGSYLGTSDSQPVVFKVNGTQAGTITPGKGVAFGQALSFFTATATGQDAFSTGEGVFANGNTSFAGGFAATAAQAGSFMWGDSNAGTGGIIATTAANQYIVRAGGGLGINGAPKDNATELSIYPSRLNGANYSSLFMGQKDAAGGILISTGEASSATSNDATFYLDAYDGTTQVRKMAITSRGFVINGSSAAPTHSSALNIYPNSQDTTDTTGDVEIAFFPTGDGSRYRQIISPDGHLGYYKTTTSDVTTSVFQFDATGDLFTNGGANLGGDLEVFGTATKTGGGSWLAFSDRRIKQDIAPIADAVDTLLKLRPVSFRYTPDFRAMEGGTADKPYLGFIAQEFAEVFPDAVTSTKKEVPGTSGEPPILALDSSPALITAVAAVQELAVQSRDRDTEVEKLRAENAELRARIDALTARMDASPAQRSQ